MPCGTKKLLGLSEHGRKIGQPKIHWLIMFPRVKLQIWGISIPSWTTPHYVRQHGLLTSDTSGSAVNHKHNIGYPP